jgi:glyoxylase-like metal-dependent hydrolase (beta-lactamase superfamily II)
MVERLIVGPMDTNCYLYSNGKKECVIIDPGGDEERIIASVNMLKMIPSAILLTHGHFDHTAAVGRLRDHYKKDGITLHIAIHKADRKYLGRNARRAYQETLSQLGLSGADEMAFTPLPEPDLSLEEGRKVLSTGLVVLETPGHTKGSVCLYSEKDALVFSGDSLFFMGIGRTDLPGSSEKSLLEAIRTKLLTLPAETRVFPGHGLDTTIEREIKGNPFIR